MNSFFALACLATLALASGSVDYCKLKCDTGAKHVACGQTEELGSGCPKGTEVCDFTDKESFRDQVLDIHNEKRNRLADSDGGKYPIATHMLTMLWDPELAKIAYYNVKQCTGGKDDCHITNTYKNPGQNIVTLPKTADSTIDSLIEKAVLGWYDAVKYSTNTTTDIASFSATGPHEDEHPAAPSARMVVDRNPVIGCASVENEHEWTLLCNYGVDVEAGKPLYTAGSTPASDCSSKHPEYVNLCSEADTVNYIKTL